MKTQIEIDINEYLSEDEKKQIAIDTFRGSILKGLTERTSSKENYANYERVISNSVYHYLEDKIDSMLDANAEELIKKNVTKTIKKNDYSHSLWRSKSAWEKEDSLAVKIQNEAVESHREEMTTRIKEKLNETINKIDSDTLYEMYQDAFNNFISDKLQSV